jgi:hypothetical protein
VLGWIAIAQIRHSSGKLYGLGLAAFDALAFPIVALDAAISLIPLKLINDVNSGEYPSMNPWGVIGVSVFCLIVIITLDCVIAIVAWRAIKRHAISPIEPAPHRPMPGPSA